jgi:FAD:protein FMN transferase
MITRCQPGLGTFVEISVPDAEDAAMGAGFAAITRVHEDMSFHEAGSDLTRLRRAAIGERVAVSPDTVTVLKTALQLFEATDGVFDVTIGRRLLATGFLPDLDRRPWRDFTGTSADVEIIGADTIICHKPLAIDLGGIAKGYAVDCAVAALLAQGATMGIVNAGGDLRVFGDTAQIVAVRGDNGRIEGEWTLQNQAMASSDNGNTRRWAGLRRVTPHIGRGGTSVRLDHVVSVVADTCMVADAMTKIAMVDPALANSLLAAHGGFVVAREIH